MYRRKREEGGGRTGRGREFEEQWPLGFAAIQYVRIRRYVADCERERGSERDREKTELKMKVATVLL